jgi:hypothetical protein
MRPRRLHLAVAALLLMGHDDGGCSCGGHEGIELGPLTGTVCPPASTLTYENFGSAFMDDYCLRCHSSEVTGADREGAPSDHNFDTLAEIRTFHEHIDQMAGSGPEATNDQMPPDDGDAPTMAEREMLAEWLACGSP